MGEVRVDNQSRERPQDWEEAVLPDAPLGVPCFCISCPFCGACAIHGDPHRSTMMKTMRRTRKTGYGAVRGSSLILAYANVTWCAWEWRD